MLINSICYPNWNDVEPSAWPLFAWHYIRKPISLILRIPQSDLQDTIAVKNKNAFDRAVNKERYYASDKINEAIKEKYQASKNRFIIGVAAHAITGGFFALHYFYGNPDSDKISICKSLGILTGILGSYCYIDGFYELSKAKNYKGYTTLKKRFYAKSAKELRHNK